LSPPKSDGVNREEQVEGVAESKNQSGDTIPLEQNVSMETVPLTPEGNNISPNREINEKVSSGVQVENIITENLETGTTIHENKVVAPPSPAKTRPEETFAEKKLKKMRRTCKWLRKMIKHLRKQLKEVIKAWKPKKELVTTAEIEV